MNFFKSIKEDLNRECNMKPQEKVDESLEVTEEVVPEDVIEIGIDGYYRVFVKETTERVRVGCSGHIHDYKEEDRYKIYVKTCLSIKILNQTVKLDETFELYVFNTKMYSCLPYTTDEVKAYERLVEILNDDEEKSKIIERIKRMAIKEVKSYCKDMNLLKMKDYVKENGKMKIEMKFTLTESELED